MSSLTTPVNWHQSEAQILVDMLRVDNRNIPLSVDDVVFGLPEILTPTTTETWNTRILVSATPTAPFRGSGYHRYHRVPITDFVYPGITNLEFVIESYTTKAELVEALSTRLDIQLDPDVVDFTYPDEVGSYTLLINNASLCFTGMLELEFINRVYRLDELITATELSGFTY